MSLFTAINNAVSGLTATQTAIITTSNNIANASTAGYTKKRVEFEPTGVQQANTGGVAISNYTRAFDDVLRRSVLSAQTDDGLNQVRNDYYTRVKTALGLDDSSPQVSDLLAKFTSAWQTLQATPESTTAQTEVLNAGNNLAQEIRRIAGAVEVIDRAVRDDLRTSVDQLNSALVNIQTLNNQIVGATLNGQPSGDFEDSRDQQILQIAALVDVQVFKRDNGAIALYTKNGIPLIDVQGSSFLFNGTDIVTNDSSATVLSSRFSGGRLEALLDFRADSSPATPSSLPGQEVIRKLRSIVNAFGQSLTVSNAGPPPSFANAYNSGTATGSELASGFFTATSGLEGSTIAVNPALLNGTATIKQASISATAQSLTATRNNLPSIVGISATTGTYASLIGVALADVSQQARLSDDAASISEAQIKGLDEAYKNKTSVNIDEELIRLQTLQQSYAANARVIGVVRDLLDILAQIAAGL